MYLSRLLLDNFASSTRRVLSDAGETHRFIMRAFPDNLQDERVLFRVEPEREGRFSTVLVQSRSRPDWSACADGLGSSDCKAIELSPPKGARLRFRLRANPTVKRNGKRIGYREESEVQGWFQRKGERHGFEAQEVETLAIPEGTIHVRRKRGPSALFESFLLEGHLRVTDKERLAAAIQDGIGSGKGFGFGLLSLGPA